MIDVFKIRFSQSECLSANLHYHFYVHVALVVCLPVLYIFAVMTLTNLCHFLIFAVSFFGLTPFGWPHTMRLHAHCILHQSLCTHCLLQTTWFICICLFFYLQSLTRSEATEKD